ncbi:hypothetical protein HGRIS_007248 [Hohenbuehelia grisea]|uniref:Uncharacterized protein n=1 Tax=Hohenbuehelia grisea TaxID=104357 RepID=A0ABR3JBW0_9AGAR
MVFLSYRLLAVVVMSMALAYAAPLRNHSRGPGELGPEALTFTIHKQSSTTIGPGECSDAQRLAIKSAFSMAQQYARAATEKSQAPNAKQFLPYIKLLAVGANEKLIAGYFDTIARMQINWEEMTAEEHRASKHEPDPLSIECQPHQIGKLILTNPSKPHVMEIYPDAWKPSAYPTHDAEMTHPSFWTSQPPADLDLTIAVLKELFKMTFLFATPLTDFGISELGTLQLLTPRHRVSNAGNYAWYAFMAANRRQLFMEPTTCPAKFAKLDVHSFLRRSPVQPPLEDPQTPVDTTTPPSLPSGSSSTTPISSNSGAQQPAGSSTSTSQRIAQEALNSANSRPLRGQPNPNGGFVPFPEDIDDVDQETCPFITVKGDEPREKLEG